MSEQYRSTGNFYVSVLLATLTVIECPWVKPAAAAETTRQPGSQLELKDAVQLARTKGLDLLLADAATQSAEADQRSAGAIPNPAVSVVYGRSFYFSQSQSAYFAANPGSNNAYTVGLTDQAAVVDSLSGKRNYRMAVAHAALQAARMGRVDAERLLVAAVKLQYFQLALLRFMESHEIRPVGASRAKSVDVRVIAATNRDLQRMVEEGKFRSDLWYRLNTVRIPLPPLRERRSDIPQLAWFFANKYNARYNRSVKVMDSGIKALQDYTWPGNVRQLQHLVERLTVLDDRIDSDTVNTALAIMESRDKPVETLADAEEDQIRRVLSATGGNKSKAAQLLGIERKTLYRKLDKLKL